MKKVIKILTQVSTRWLSLSTCLQRLVDQCDALLQYFRREAESDLFSPLRCESVRPAGLSSYSTSYIVLYSADCLHLLRSKIFPVIIFSFITIVFYFTLTRLFLPTIDTAWNAVEILGMAIVCKTA